MKRLSIAVALSSILLGCPPETEGARKESPSSGGNAPSPSASITPEAYCPCENLGSSKYSLEVSFSCLCENWECPKESSVANMVKPEDGFRVVLIECSGERSVVARTNGYFAVQFFYSGGRFSGMRVDYDYPALCETALSVRGGLSEISADECAPPCILSHGSTVARPGECLDPEKLPEVTDFRVGAGGEGGFAVSAGGYGGG